MGEAGRREVFPVTAETKGERTSGMKESQTPVLGMRVRNQV